MACAVDDPCITILKAVHGGQNSILEHPPMLYSLLMESLNLTGTTVSHSRTCALPNVQEFQPSLGD